MGKTSLNGSFSHIFPIFLTFSEKVQKNLLTNPIYADIIYKRLENVPLAQLDRATAF
jgi:hypothetical protein